MQYSELVQDHDTQQWVCREDQDIPDPWRQQQRGPDYINLDHPRPDTDISTTVEEDDDPPVQR